MGAQSKRSHCSERCITTPRGTTTNSDRAETVKNSSSSSSFSCSFPNSTTQGNVNSSLDASIFTHACPSPGPNLRIPIWCTSYPLEVLPVFGNVHPVHWPRPPRFTGHSFRIGAATQVAASGLLDAFIHHRGCWRSDLNDASDGSDENPTIKPTSHMQCM